MSEQRRMNMVIALVISLSLAVAVWAAHVRASAGHDSGGAIYASHHAPQKL